MLIMAVTALCRLNLSIAGKYIQDEFSFNTVTMGWLFSAFLLGYALFQIPWGYIGDEYGPRRILTISILIWSVGTVAMGLAPRFALGGAFGILWAFVIVRFATGVGEAAVSPNVTRVIASWTAPRERGLASGLQISGLGLGGTMTPILISWTVAHWGWRISFYLCAALGFLVIVVWRLYTTDRPEEHPGVNATELERIRPGAQHADRNADLTARRAGKELAQRHDVGILRLVDPPTSDDVLLAEVAEVGDRPAEGGQPEACGHAEHFQRRSVMGPGSRAQRRHAAILMIGPARGNETSATGLFGIRLGLEVW